MIANSLCTAVTTGPAGNFYAVGGLVMLMGVWLIAAIAFVVWLILVGMSFRKQASPATRKTAVGSSLLFIMFFVFMTIPHMQLSEVLSMASLFGAMALVFNAKAVLGDGKARKWLLRLTLVGALFFIWLLGAECYIWYA